MVEGRLTEHGGSASVDLAAVPALELLFGKGDKLDVQATGLSVDITRDQEQAFKRLDEFDDVVIFISDSRAGPLTVRRFTVRRTGDHEYAVTIVGNGTAGDVARYAGSRLGGGLGQALAGLAASAISDFTRPIPFNARMQIDTSSGSPQAHDVVGSIAGLPAGPLAEIVANALLGGL